MRRDAEAAACRGGRSSPGAVLRLAGTGLLLLPLTACGGGKPASPVTVTVQASAATSPGAASSTPTPSAGAPSAGAPSAGAPSAGASSAGVGTPSGAAGASDEPAAKDVQGLLQQLNYRVPLSGSYDAVTRGVLRSFQSSHGLPATGIVDAATRQALAQAVATFSPKTTTDDEGYTFDGTWWSADELFRSRNRECVVHEQRWQRAVEENSKSGTEDEEAAARALGCDPDQWTPRGMPHPMVNEVHLNGEPCTAAEGGTIATGSRPVAICNQYRVGVWRWHVTSA